MSPISLSSLTTVGGVLAAATSIFIVTIVQRLFFHPLSQFPGPKLAAATWWYMTYYEVFQDGALVFHLDELHASYGT